MKEQEGGQNEKVQSCENHLLLAERFEVKACQVQQLLAALIFRMPLPIRVLARCTESRGGAYPLCRSLPWDLSPSLVLFGLGRNSIRRVCGRRSHHRPHTKFVHQPASVMRRVDKQQGSSSIQHQERERQDGRRQPGVRPFSAAVEVSAGRRI